MPDIKIFPTKKIITMNPSNPEGTHVAVRKGRIASGKYPRLFERHGV